MLTYCQADSVESKLYTAANNVLAHHFSMSKHLRIKSPYCQELKRDQQLT